MTLEITPCGPLNSAIRPPGSKSITNRALVCAALARGESTLVGVLDSEDTRVMIDGLGRLGISVIPDHQKSTVRVRGCDGQIPRASAELFVGNSGTTVRFLTAFVTLGQGRYVLDGVARMRERPIQDLLDALAQLGADTRSSAGTGHPPVVVNAHGLRGGGVKVRGNISSQYLSGLLMAAPYADKNVAITVEGGLVSQPYVNMTLSVMTSFGAIASKADNGYSVSSARQYEGCRYEIEPDASAASYFWAAAAITGGKVEVLGLSKDSIQGDIRFCDCLQRMGCTVNYLPDRIVVQGGKRLRGIQADMNAISDTVQTLATVALFADGPTTISGVAHNRHKETDRISDLARELRVLGAEVDEYEDGLRVMPRETRGGEIRTYNDHRMAMSLALAGLRVPHVRIQDPGCVAKTYPKYFQDLASVCDAPPGGIHVNGPS